MSFYFPIILETWQRINTEPVCFGARNNRYGAFNITKSGLLKTMKLVYKPGSIKCNLSDPASYWGCTYQSSYGNNGLMTIITNVKKEAILPPARKLKATAFATTQTTFTVLMELPTHLQSSCSAILLIRYRCHAIRSCRYGPDRIGLIVVKVTTMEQHVLMCMCGMLKKRHR